MFKTILISIFISVFSLSLLASSIQNGGKVRIDKKLGESIDCPEDMDRNFDELLQLWAENGNNTIECDYNPDNAIVFDDSVYINRLYALPSQMELAYNSAVKQFIEMYANRRRGQVSYMLGLGTYYFPMFEEALDREGLPLELKYLPVIESALNPIARSRAGATGLWQFMPATGKMYQLEINSLVDERRDPYKSTQAAVKYLKDMYNVYEDWNLVIAAYNCGPGNVNKAIKRSGGKRDYWDIYPYLPKETRGYVPAFIAATYIMNYYPQHNICPKESELPTLIDTLNVNRMVHFEQIADMVNISVSDIQKLNPQFKEDIIPGEYKSYALKLPIQNLTEFIEKEDTIYAHRADELLTHKKIRSIASRGNAPSSGGYATYKVRRGDTMGAIAVRHGITISQLKDWNNMRSDKLNVGQNLRVSAYVAPEKQEEKVSAGSVQDERSTVFVVDNGSLKKTTTVTKTITSTYKVKKGDTWASIAKNTGASIADIKNWNGIRGSKLVAGRNLKIKKIETVEELEEVSKPKAIALNSHLTTCFDTYMNGLDLNEPVASLGILNPERVSVDVEDNDLENSLAIYHKVVFGETVSQIAKKYNVTISDILSWNNITEENSSQVTRLLILIPQKEVEKRMVKNADKEEDKDTAQL